MVATRRARTKKATAAGALSAEPRKAAVMALMRLSDRLRNRFTAVLEPWGLTVQQYNVLRILRGALPDALPTMEIAARMIEQAPAITGLLDRLEAKKLVSRARQTDDRRCVRCSITTTGLDLLAGLDEPIERADAAALAGLDDAEIRRLTGLLVRATAE